MKNKFKSALMCSIYYETLYIWGLSCIEFIFHTLTTQIYRKKMFFEPFFAKVTPKNRPKISEKSSLSRQKLLIFLRKLSYVSQTVSKCSTREYFIFLQYERIYSTLCVLKKVFKVRKKGKKLHFQRQSSKL